MNGSLFLKEILRRHGVSGSKLEITWQILDTNQAPAYTDTKKFKRSPKNNRRERYQKNNMDCS